MIKIIGIDSLCEDTFRAIPSNQGIYINDRYNGKEYFLRVKEDVDEVIIITKNLGDKVVITPTDIGDKVVITTKRGEIKRVY